MRHTNQLTWGLVLSGAGHPIHNVQEFGLGVLAGVETLLPVGITVLLIAAVRRRTSQGVLLVVGMWALVVLVVGGGSVFPLALLPFEPEQSAAHYITHAVYALLQLPLLAATSIAWAELRGHHHGRIDELDRPEDQTTVDRQPDPAPTMVTPSDGCPTLDWSGACNGMGPSRDSAERRCSPSSRHNVTRRHTST